jgi:uncharacterized membrane protein (UPF0127 family)
MIVQKQARAINCGIMLNRQSFLVFTAFMTILAFLALASLQARALETFPVSTLTIKSKDATHRFTVEVANSPRQQAQGLMFRRKMAADAGMVFIYSSAKPISMWMKNTLIPLDMVFINASGAVSRIVERTTPMSQTIISSGGPAKAVLELNGGAASRLKLKTGDRVVLKDVFPK